MKRKRVVLLSALLLSLLMMGSMLVGITAQAGGPPTDAANAQADGSNTSSSSSSSSHNDTQGVIISGYECYVHGQALNSGSVISQITPGMNLDIAVTIQDSRPGIDGALKPFAYLNTGAFVKVGQTHRGDTYVAGSENGGDNIFYDGAVARYTLVFPVNYTGTGKTFAFDLHYQDNFSLPMFTFSLDLNQAVESPSSSSSTGDSGSTSTRGTGFVLKSASYGGGEIQAGGSFQLNVVLLSTNGVHNVENVYISVTPDKEIALKDGSSVYYIGTVAPNQEVPVAFDLEAGDVQTEGSYKITLTVKGIDSLTGSEVSATMDIAVPVIFSERFELFNIQLPETLTVGDTNSGFGTVTLVNKGKGIIHNVTLAVTGEGLSLVDGNQFIGNINAGAQSSADITLLALQPGELSGVIEVTYENAKGEEKSLTHPFNVTADEMGDFDYSLPPDIIEEPQTGMPVWGWLLIALGLAAAAIVTVVLLRRRKAKKDAELLDDYDEDSGDETV